MPAYFVELEITPSLWVCVWVCVCLVQAQNKKKNRSLCLLYCFSPGIFLSRKMVPKMLEMLAVKKKKYDEEAVKRKRKQEETRARNKRNREKKVRYMTKPPGRGGVGRSFLVRARACVCFHSFLVVATS